MAGGSGGNDEERPRLRNRPVNARSRIVKKNGLGPQVARAGALVKGKLELLPSVKMFPELDSVIPEERASLLVTRFGA